MEETSVKSFYKGKNIFITGATGFVGIAVVEKLLRCIPDVGNIYLLVRPKRGKEVSERLEEIKKNRIFEKICEEKGTDLLDKIKAVAGDVGEENLGLSEEDRKLLIDNVNVTFHSAATLDFEASLKTTTIINLLGTRRVVELCKQMKNLMVLLHVSSAYVNVNLREVGEVLYPAPDNADKIIELATTLSEQTLDEMTPTILGTHVNTYTFTKALAEHEVANAISSFPTCIVRPSQIVPAWKEPVPGWTMSKNGPPGFMMGVAKGVVRRLPLDPNIVCDYVPVDIVVNGIITSAQSTALKRPSATPIYHLTSSTTNPFKWEMVTHKMTYSLHKFPLKSAVWYPAIKLIPSIFWFRISAVIFHFLPGYILDFVTKITGGRPILVKLHNNVNKSLDRLEPFIFNEWKFYSKNTLELHNSLNEEEKETFGTDIQTLHWFPYFENLILGVREYLNNEKLTTLEDGKKKDKILWILNIIVQLLFLSTLSSMLLLGIGFSFVKFLLSFSFFAVILELL